MSITSPEVRMNGDGLYSLAEAITQLSTEVATLRGEVQALKETRSPSVRVVSEPLTYDARLVRDPRGPLGFRAVPTRENSSYVADLASYQLRMSDWREAEHRLRRHEKEMRTLSAESSRLFHPDVEYEFEQRTVSWANGQGGYFAPPLWIIEQFATVPTPERVLSAKAPKFDLPEGCQSVNLPAWTGNSADVSVQALGTPATSVDLTDNAIQSAVATIAGNEDVPLQMLEQSPVGAHLDWAVFSNMEARYGYKLELQLLVGTGAATPQGSGNNQLLGLFNNTAIPAANQVQYTGAGEGAAAGATGMYSSIGLLPAKIGQNRLLPPECWLMSTSRGAWLASSEDQQSRPLMISDNIASSGTWDLMGYQVFLNDAIPRNLGTGANEDRIIACRPSDWLVLEADPRTSVFREVISGNLMARIQLRRYVAALLRYPTSVAYLYGSGMATGAGF